MFGSEQRQAKELRTALTNDPVLKLYRAGAETELHTDASKYGLGAILLQKDADDGTLHPIYYVSWKTTLLGEKYTSYELEVLVVIKALKKFRVYVLGIPIKIVTDCRAFALTMTKKDMCLRVSHWALMIEEFDYVIEHRPGKTMRHADALNRNPTSVFTLRSCQDSLVMRVRQAKSEDSELSKMVQSARDTERKEFTTKRDRDILYRESDGNSTLSSTETSPIQCPIQRQIHERGHFGWKRTEWILQQVSSATV